MTPSIRDRMQRFSLRAQTILLMVGMGTILCIGISFLVYQRDLGKISQRIEQLSKNQTELIKNLSIESILSEDRPALQTIVDGLESMELGIDRMTITNFNGDVLASWEAEDGQKTNHYHTRTPIEYLGQNFGEIYLEWNRDALVAPMKARAADIVRVIVASIIAIGICLVLFVEFYFVRPLASLEEKVEVAMGNSSAELKPHNFCSRELTHLDKSLVAAGIAIRERETNEKQLREEKARTKAAEAVASARTEFLSLMSHEIRTPLGAILGFADLLDSSDIRGEEREYVGHIRESGAFLLQILNDILDLSKIEAEGIQLENVPFSPLSVMEDVALMLQDKAKSKNVDLTIDSDIDETLIVEGDPLRLKQVILNLVGNSVKFTHQGHIVISAKPAPAATKVDGQLAIRFSVKDSGIGMSPDFVEKIFEPFSQADASITRKFGGTGLGVSISHKLVSIMKSELCVVSEEGVGSEFFFTLHLPLSSRTAEKVEEFSERKEIHLEPESKAFKILVAEDDPANQSMVKKVLTRMGHEVKFADDGEECLDLLMSREKFDFLFLDLRMPKINGLEALRRIRGGECGEAASRMPISMMSADVLSQDEARESGADDFIVKPTGIDKIQKFLGHLERKPARSEHHERKTIPETPETNGEKNQAGGNDEKWIMVVDDNPAVRQMIEKFLARWGYRTGIAVDGMDCLRQLANHHYDAVISDLRMPGMDGVTLINRIREGDAGDAYREVSVALMTAEQMTEEDAYEARADAYIPKPIPMDRLKGFLQSMHQEPVSLVS